ncbi:sulfotransferase 1C2-like [Liolophura sinensis]|uniref:sulfotransferase 1C2-like n=1 Tax=Liolophura sinensis TaxID=3198878 RepID=UPI00315840D2
MAPWRKHEFTHKLPGEHVYNGILFFGFSPPDTLRAVRDFTVREDDVFIATYPKAGTTWMQEIIWLIMHDGDFKGASETPVYFRSPFLEFKDEILNEVGLELANPMSSPRVIKTHLPYSMIPRHLQQHSCKTVVVFRNPKDLCVSYYHFYKSSSSMGNFQGSWEEFFEMFMTGHVDHGSWFDYTKSWWEVKDNPNVKVTFYEDMKRDLRKEVVELCSFLGKPLSNEIIDDIVRHCGFESMRRNPMTNHEDVYSINKEISPLMRKGTVGDWKNYFTVAQNELADYFYRRHLGDTGLQFTYEL